MIIIKKYNHYYSKNNYKFYLIPTIELDKLTVKRETYWTVNTSVVLHFLNFSFQVTNRQRKIVLTKACKL